MRFIGDQKILVLIKDLLGERNDTLLLYLPKIIETLQGHIQRSHCDRVTLPIENLPISYPLNPNTTVHLREATHQKI